LFKTVLLSDEMTDHEDSLNTTGASDDSDTKTRTNIFPSSSSAFSKIEKYEGESDGSEPKSSQTLQHSPMGLYPGYFPPGFYSPFFSGGMMPRGTEGITSVSSPTSTSVPNPFPNFSFSGPSKPSTDSEDAHRKNMFYYVDPRIPFTNYFMNLTKLLSGTAKEYRSETSPLRKFDCEDARADEQDHPISPRSTISSPEKSFERDSLGDISKNSAESFESDLRTSRKNPLNIDVGHNSHIADKLTSTGIDPRFMTPFNSPFLPFSASVSQSSGFPGVAGTSMTSMFHPAMLPFAGHPGSLRRYNPDKPAPVKKYKCDVCGKAFSRSNTLVTHKVGASLFSCFKIC